MIDYTWTEAERRQYNLDGVEIEIRKIYIRRGDKLKTLNIVLSIEFLSDSAIDPNLFVEDAIKNAATNGWGE